MAAVGEHKCAALSEQLSGAVASLPGRDVIGQAGDHISVCLHLAHIQREATHLDPSGIDVRVGADEIEEIGVQLGRKARRVVIPVENIEGRRGVAEQVIVDPVVPNQIVGSHPSKHAGEFPSMQHAQGL